MSQPPPIPVPPHATKAKRLASADALAAEGRTQDAIALYRQILADDPKDTEVIGRLADMYSRLAASIRQTIERSDTT